MQCICSSKEMIIKNKVLFTSAWKNKKEKLLFTCGSERCYTTAYLTPVSICCISAYHITVLYQCTSANLAPFSVKMWHKDTQRARKEICRTMVRYAAMQKVDSGLYHGRTCNVLSLHEENFHPCPPNSLSVHILLVIYLFTNITLIQTYSSPVNFTLKS